MPANPTRSPTQKSRPVKMQLLYFHHSVCPTAPQSVPWALKNNSQTSLSLPWQGLGKQPWPEDPSIVLLKEVDRCQEEGEGHVCCPHTHPRLFQCLCTAQWCNRWCWHTSNTGARIEYKVGHDHGPFLLKWSVGRRSDAQVWAAKWLVHLYKAVTHVFQSQIDHLPILRTCTSPVQMQVMPDPWRKELVKLIWMCELEGWRKEWVKQI